MAKVVMTFTDNAEGGTDIDVDFDPVVDGDNVTEAQDLAISVIDALRMAGTFDHGEAEYEGGEVVEL